MPTYNYQCTGCELEFTEIRSMNERALTSCPECGNKAEQTLSRPRAVHGFKYGWFEHMALEPVYAKSKRHLKELCNQHGCRAVGVLD
jgi:putative FmdB family regulatory protein